MATVTAKLSNYRQSPRKVRVVADLVRGKKVPVALSQLTFLPKRAGDTIKNLIESAVANAKNLSIEAENLFVTEIRVDKGVTLHRSMPRARGSASRINKRSSHVMVVLDTQSIAESKKQARLAKKAKTSKTEVAAEAKPKAAAKKTKTAKKESK